MTTMGKDLARALDPAPTAADCGLTLDGWQAELMRARSAIACAHKDAIDLDRLRHDPLMKIAVGRCPTTGAPLVSQSTIQPSGECAEQDAGGAARRNPDRSGRHDREAAQAGDPRHRRYVLCGAWRSAVCVLECTSRNCELLAPDRWQIEGKQCSVGHGGYGARLITVQFVSTPICLCESRTLRHSRHKTLPLWLHSAVHCCQAPNFACCL
jgi:hypothetical protein